MFLAYLRHFTESKASTQPAARRPAGRRFSTTQWLALGLLTSSLVACAKQGEGERCDLLSGDDCEDGLECRSLDDRNQGIGAVCCPSEGDSNSAICKGNSVDLDGDGGADTSSNTSSGVETRDASSVDASVGTDAAVDAAAPDSSTSETTDAGVEDTSVTNDADASDSSTADESSSSVAETSTSSSSDNASDSSSSTTSDAVSTTTDTVTVSDETSTLSDAGSDGSVDASE